MSRNKSDNSKQIAFYLTFNKQRAYSHEPECIIYPVTVNEDGIPRNLSSWNSEDWGLADLHFRCYFNKEYSSFHEWLKFEDMRIEQADHAVAIASTLKKIERGMQKFNAEEGYSDCYDFPEKVRRIALILGIKRFYAPTPETASAWGYDDRKHEVLSISAAMKRIADWQDKVSGKVAEEVAA